MSQMGLVNTHSSSSSVTLLCMAEISSRREVGVVPPLGTCLPEETRYVCSCFYDKELGFIINLQFPLYSERSSPVILTRRRMDVGQVCCSKRI
jgi:hypothetical protein